MPDRLVKGVAHALSIRVATPIWLYLIMWGLIVVGAVRIEQSINSNQEAISELNQIQVRQDATDIRIQASRVHSCRSTYRAITGILDISLSGGSLTEKKRAKIIQKLPRKSRKRARDIYELVNPDRCGVQTRVKTAKESK